MTCPVCSRPTVTRHNCGNPGCFNYAEENMTTVISVPWDACICQEMGYDPETAPYPRCWAHKEDSA